MKVKHGEREHIPHTSITYSALTTHETIVTQSGTPTCAHEPSAKAWAKGHAFGATHLYPARRSSLLSCAHHRARDTDGPDFLLLRYLHTPMSKKAKLCRA